MKDIPSKGDVYKCDECGMTLKVTADCACKEDDDELCPCFKCCGCEMCKQSA